MSGVRLWSRSGLLVVAFVVLDLVIVASALVLSHRAPAPTSGSAPASDATGAFEQASTPLIEAPLALAASGDGALVRVTRGSCDSRDPERSRVWTSTGADQPLVGRDVPRLQETLGVAYRGSTVSLVGATADCTVAGFVSADGGRTWGRQKNPPSGVWWLDTDSSDGSVHGPERDVSVQCVPVAVSTLGDGSRALVTCDQDQVQVVGRASSRTETSFQVTGAAAAAGPPERPLVLADDAGCPASLGRAGARPTDGSSSALRGSRCLSRTGAGTGLAVSGQRVFAQVGYRLLVSDDGGATFAPYTEDPVTRQALAADSGQ